MRLWYVRRGAPWAPLLTCCTLGAIAALLGRQWPESLTLVRPAALACCAAGAAFVFDEGAVPVVAVTPRGAWWRRSARLALVALPFLAWSGVLALEPAAAPTHRPSWALAGTACIVASVGVAALLARREVAAPGTGVAAAATFLVLAPAVVGPVAGWDPVLPLGAFPDWAVALWCAVAVCGAASTAWAVRPGLR